jgi:transposase-like protein
MNNETPIKKHRRYDEGFKRTAVEHWMISGQSATAIAAELGIPVQNRTNGNKNSKHCLRARSRPRWRRSRRRTAGCKKNCTAPCSSVTF